MTISTYGLIGAVLGLVAAFTTYSAMQPVLQQAEAKSAEGLNGERPKMSVLRIVLLADFVILAAVGYYLGQQFE
jgi:hypothetical protein